MERVMGIEPTLSAWEAEVLPLNYTRRSRVKIIIQQRVWKQCPIIQYRRPNPSFRLT